MLINETEFDKVQDNDEEALYQETLDYFTENDSSSEEEGFKSLR